MALSQRAEPPAAVLAPPAAVRVAPAVGQQAYRLLWVAFVALPLLAGVDKFFNALGPWGDYLALEIPDLLGVSPRSVMHAVGGVEIFAGLMVAFWPRAGGWLVAAWLWAVAANLLILSGHYDVVLRDLALSLGALALTRLAPPVEW
jgi:hypothetical protein